MRKFICLGVQKINFLGGFTTKTLKDLKEAMSKDKELKKQFMSLKSKEEAVSLAHNMGYEISLEELENDEEINEDLLESVAGGSDKIDIESVDVKVQDVGEGKNSKIDNKTDINKEIDNFQKLERSFRK